MHQQDLTIRRSILPHSEGGTFTSWYSSQDADFILLEWFEGPLFKILLQQEGLLLFCTVLQVLVSVQYACTLVP